MDDGPDWRMRAEALEEELEWTRDLAASLLAAIPVAETLSFLESFEASALVLPLGEESSAPVPADVKRELERTWRSLRLGPPRC